MCILNINEILLMDDKSFFDNFSYIMHISLVKDLNLYTDLIDKMYEICERNKDTLEDILERANKAVSIINIKHDINDSFYPLNFGKTIATILKSILTDNFSDGEYLSLGCVAEGFISYKKNWLTKEEYYEIRDMFVPFYLPISVEMLDIPKALDAVNQLISNNDNGNYSFVLLKKIGKTVVDTTVTTEDIKAALEELNFDEAW